MVKLVFTLVEVVAGSLGDESGESWLRDSKADARLFWRLSS
jgi:hypothetical protein